MKKLMFLGAMASVSALLLASCGSNGKTDDLEFTTQIPDGYKQLSDSEGNALWHEILDAMPQKIDELVKKKNLVVTSKETYDRSATTEDESDSDISSYYCKSITDFTSCKFSSHTEMTRKYEGNDETSKKQLNYSFSYDISGSWTEEGTYTAAASVKTDNYRYLVNTVYTTEEDPVVGKIKTVSEYQYDNFTLKGMVYYAGCLYSACDMETSAANRNIASYYPGNSPMISQAESNTDHTSGSYLEYYRNSSGSVIVNVMSHRTTTNDLFLYSSMLYGKDGIIKRIQCNGTYVDGRWPFVWEYEFTKDKPSEMNTSSENPVSYNTDSIIGIDLLNTNFNFTSKSSGEDKPAYDLVANYLAENESETTTTE